MNKFSKTNFPIKARVNSDLNMQIDVGFSITGHTPKFTVKKDDGSTVDLSSYCSVTTDTVITVSVNADIIKTQLGAIKADYDVIIDKGAGSKEFLFSGIINVEDGISA